MGKLLLTMTSLWSCCGICIKKDCRAAHCGLDQPTLAARSWQAFPLFVKPVELPLGFGPGHAPVHRIGASRLRRRSRKAPTRMAMVAGHAPDKPRVATLQPEPEPGLLT
jgi:hypothetical protein